MRKIMVNKKNQIMCEEYRDSLERYKSKDAIYATKLKKQIPLVPFKNF